MGCPDLYYKRMLEYVLDIFHEKRESSQEDMEDKILKLKSTIESNRFYFECGFACGTAIEQAYHEGGDQWNASSGGASAFEDFIGLGEDE